jgi:hypothetical protein
MDSKKKRGRPNGQRRRRLVVTGEVHLPTAIFDWELDLLKPVLIGTFNRERQTAKNSKPQEPNNVEFS